MRLFSKFKNNKVITPEVRRSKSNDYIKKLGIACYDNLPVIESSSNAKLKDLDTICKRAIASLLSIQVACDIEQNNNYEESKTVMSKLLKVFNVESELLKSEKKLFNNNYTEQDIKNVIWTYECYWSLIWALGLIDTNEMIMPNDICDCQKAITIVGDCKNYEDFKSKTKLRDIEEILDMLDLYYRYHWACVEKRLKPETNIGTLDPEVVWERRRGLEWLISNIDDWNEISLDT